MLVQAADLPGAFRLATLLRSHNAKPHQRRRIGMQDIPALARRIMGDDNLRLAAANQFPQVVFNRVLIPNVGGGGPFARRAQAVGKAPKVRLLPDAGGVQGAHSFLLRHASRGGEKGHRHRIPLFPGQYGQQAPKVIGFIAGMRHHQQHIRLLRGRLRQQDIFRQISVYLDFGERHARLAAAKLRAVAALWHRIALVQQGLADRKAVRQRAFFIIKREHCLRRDASKN